eukprot:2349224-Rhodomonas_salina.1
MAEVTVMAVVMAIMEAVMIIMDSLLRTTEALLTIMAVILTMAATWTIMARDADNNGGDADNNGGLGFLPVVQPPARERSVSYPATPLLRHVRLRHSHWSHTRGAVLRLAIMLRGAVRSCYAMCGSEIGCAATRYAGQLSRQYQQRACSTGSVSTMRLWIPPMRISYAYLLCISFHSNAARQVATLRNQRHE